MYTQENQKPVSQTAQLSPNQEFQTSVSPTQVTDNRGQSEQPVAKQSNSWLNWILIVIGFIGVSLVVAVIMLLLQAISAGNKSAVITYFLLYASLFFPIIVILIVLGLIGAIKRAKEEKQSNPFTVIFLIVFIFIILLMVLYRGAFILPLISLFAG